MAEDKKVLVEDDDEELEQDAEGTEYVAVEKPVEAAQKETDDDDDDDEDEETLKSSDDDDDREAIRARRREEKKERKERREKAIGRDKIELTFLRQRNDELERRMMAVETHTKQSTLSDFDRQIQEALNEAETAERIIAKAVEAGNGEDVTKAMRFRDQAVAKAQQLTQTKQYQQQQTHASPQNNVDNAVVSFAKDFMSTNKWYDPTGKDEDSAIVLAIDARLSQEGFDPRTEEYWDELQDRVERRLPEKFAKQERAVRKPQGGPAVGSGRQHAPTSTKKEIYISPERKQAMQEAGVWDDPVLRQRYTKRYAEYDKQNRN
jgi:hypothetical protein